MQQEEFSRYERARILGARALQIAMDAPILIKISDEKLKKINHNPLEVAEMELNEGILPITVNRPMPEIKVGKLKIKKEEEKKEDKKPEEVKEEEAKKETELAAKKEEKEVEEIAEEGEIMELAKPEDEVEETEEVDAAKAELE